MATARNHDIRFCDAIRVVEELVREITFHKHGVHVTKPVLLAGSLGQHTAVPGNYDVDLVIYSDNINPLTVLKEGYEKPLHQIRSHMGREWRVTLKEPSTMSVSMKYESSGVKIDVDILVSPNWKCPEDFYKFLTTAKTIHKATPAEMFRFSVNASKEQVEFLKKQTEKARELIRRAKAWKSKEWPEGIKCTGRPKSYLITLLVLRAYEKAKANVLSRASIEQRTTEELIEIVEDHLSANIYWTDYYKPQDYPKLFPAIPRIVDPANPANNLHETGIIAGGRTSYSYELGNGKWTEFVRKIGTIDLSKTIEQIQTEN